MNQTISTLSRQADSLQSLGAIIALSAPANHGKTSTLLHLAEQLATHGKNKVYCENIYRFIQTCFPIDKKPKDVRMIIRYCDAYIYIATGGDDEHTIKQNIEFFNNKPCQYVMADVEGNVQTYQDIPLDIMPRVCISASRSDTAVGFDLLEKRARNTGLENLLVIPKEKNVDTEARMALVKMIDFFL